MRGINLKTFAQQARVALLQYYSVPLAVAFRQFRNGAIYFGVGLMSVIMANQYMPPSVKQEAVVLAGLCLTGIGFVMALMAEVRMVISRLVQFARKR